MHKAGCIFSLAFSIIVAPIATADCYEYDDLGRLINATYSDGGDSHYDLDEHGNRQSVDITTSNSTCLIPSLTLTNGHSSAVTSAVYNSTNGAPVSNSFELSLYEYQSAIVNPVDRDDVFDPDGDPLVLTSVSLVDPADPLTVQENGNGFEATIISTGGLGLFTVNYTVSDGVMESSGQITVEISVADDPTPPDGGGGGGSGSGGDGPPNDPTCNDPHCQGDY